MAKSPAWTRKEGKNPEGGLNEKGRASLRAAGHDIKRPQPEGGARKDSFCARMKGMKAKLTSSETANDPDSRINKSLRKWNCHADGGAIDVARQYRETGGKTDYDRWKEQVDRANELNDRYAYPEKYNVSPEEYRKGNLGHGKYALSHGGRAGYATGGDPGIPTTNPVVSAQDPNANYVRSLYQNIMGRPGEQAGVDYWTGQLSKGATNPSDIMSQFAASNEFQNLYKANPAQAVSALYQEALGRAPDLSGQQYWQQQAQQGMSLADMVRGFTQSNEGKSVRDINDLYLELTGQVATPEQLKQGLTNLTPQSDYMDFIQKTFPYQESGYGDQYAGGKRTDAGPNVWGQVSAAPVGEQGRAILDLIGAGEGGYDTARVNTGKGVKPNYNYSIGDNPLSNATIADVIKQQGAGNINAVGKYQFIPDVLKEIVRDSGIDPNTKFDAATQDKLALFRAYNYRSRLRDYLEGKSDNLRGAMIDLAKEWRSFPNPATGMSWDAHNRSKHTLAQVKQALMAARGNMWTQPTQFAGMPGGAPVAQDQNLGVTLTNAGAGGNVYTPPPPNPIPGTITNPAPSVTPSTLPGGWVPPGPSFQPQPIFLPTPSMYGWDVGNAGIVGSMGGSGSVAGFGGGGGGGAGTGGGSVGGGGFSVGFGPGMASGGAVDIARSYRKAGGPVWDKPRPKHLGKPEKLSPSEKSSAKAAAKAAGRPYPNLVDNMRAAREDGGSLRPFMEAKIEEIGDKELGKYGIGPKAPASTKDELKAGPEQSTWEKIASKAMGDRPSPERRRFVEGAGNIADVAHMGAYATPLAPYVGAADFARGVASGDPMEAALGATGLPGRGAKAVGVAASAMMPESAEAGPLAKALNAIRAYHGSPHWFDKFDISKIGTGEGAQAYGHGLYFADREGVARSYRDAVSNMQEVTPHLKFEGSTIYRGHDLNDLTPAQIAAQSVAELGGIDQSRRTMLDFSKSPYTGKMWSDALAELEANPHRFKDVAWQKPGYMYEVDIHADPSHMLDWDKPLSEQHPNVINSISDVVRAAKEDAANPFSLSGNFQGSRSTEYGNPEKYKDLSGAALHDMISRVYGHEMQSNELRNRGIPGIRYLDAASRGAGEGTSNYVVFDPNIIEILRRYKEGGRVEAAGGGAMTKFLRELAEKYRPHYDPSARIAGQPREKWLSQVKLSRPIEEMRVTSQEHRPMVAERFTRPEDYAGKALITGLGDRTPAGYEVTSVNDRILRSPTNMFGGMGFGRDVSSLGPDKAVWGSALTRAQAIANRAKDAADRGYEPIFTYVAQGPESGDFSHHMQDLVLGQLDPRKMDPNLAAKIDKRMREAQTASGDTFAPKPEWAGIQSPDAAARMRSRADERVKLIKEMDAAAYRDAPGFADIGASRFASTEPSLMFDPSFSAGRSFMSIDPTGRVITNPANPHPSYDTFVPAAPNSGHGYLGRLEYELPPELHFKHYRENEIKPELRGKPLDKQTMSILKQQPTVMATPEWVDSASEWQNLMTSLYGKRSP